MAFKFENLRVWKTAVNYSGMIHELVKTFPQEERFVLSPQLMRASDSISLNIAEGSTGQTDLEQRKFLGYAMRSGMEVIACLYIAKERKLISQKQFSDYYNQCEKLIIMLQAFRNSLDKKQV